jgi:hypothetical protein
MEVILPCGRAMQIDDIDLIQVHVIETAPGVFEEFRVIDSSWAMKPCTDSTNYVCGVSPLGACVRLHRLIMDAAIGDIIDHIDGDGLNNAKSNLRFVTSQQNAMNRRAWKNKRGSRFKGVHRDGKRFRAIITVNRKNIGLGSFKTEEEAAEAYNKAASEMFGEFACLNIIDNRSIA